ncbi:glycosyltransferase [Algibacter sp. Ld11]|uniref:CgeB family protein n=1 Tax=Algibacter sp. Ld11 TaxID=649150 RepID=UPI0038700482
MNILFVHPPEGNAYELFKAFKKNINCKIKLLSIEKGKQFSFLDKIRFKLKLPTDLYSYNQLLIDVDLSEFNIVFIVKGIALKSKTLKKLKNKYPNLKIISWSQDDMYAWHNRSIYYTLGLKHYDLVTTTKTYNIKELKKLGAKKIYFHNKAYSQHIHFPVHNLKSKYSHDVVFIGTLETERFESMNYLAKKGIVVNIYTNSFNDSKFAKHHKNLIIHKGGLFGKEYAEAITNSKITLCFLRKINRDLQTSRSIEIPACGGCMLAERTVEHLSLFEENKEAMYFESDPELLQKIQNLLENDTLRSEIVKNALNRCKVSGYSYQDLAKKLVLEFNQI